MIRYAITTAGLFVALAVSARTAAAQVPTIDLDFTCQASAGVMANLLSGGTGLNDKEICLDSEKKARQQIIDNLANYPAADRERCIQPSDYLPSYVEWFTCFEMNRVVRQAREQGRSVQELFNSDGSISLPPLRNLTIMRRP
jgi:hypothetical protein